MVIARVVDAVLVSVELLADSISQDIQIQKNKLISVLHMCCAISTSKVEQKSCAASLGTVFYRKCFIELLVS